MPKSAVDFLIDRFIGAVVQQTAGVHSLDVLGAVERLDDILLVVRVPREMAQPWRWYPYTTLTIDVRRG